jgi:hypothetical protein
MLLIFDDIMGSTEEHTWAPDSENIKMEFIADAVVERKIPGLFDRLKKSLSQMMESRRYQDGSPDPDYEHRLRELEGQLEREYSGLRLRDYNEGGGGKWDKWMIPGLVTLAVSGIIGNVVQAMAVSALRQEVTDLKAEVDRIERMVELRMRDK